MKQCISHTTTFIDVFETMQNWTKLTKSGDVPWPEERSYHAACCLNYGQLLPQLLITGGQDKQWKPLSDAWVFDVESGRWSKVR